MKALRFGLLALAILGSHRDDFASAQDNRPTPENTKTISAETARPIVESYQKGDGWAFARTRIDNRGNRFVCYRFVVGVQGTINVGGKPMVMLTTSPETSWVPLEHFSLPVLGGKASTLLREVWAEIRRPRDGLTPTEASRLAELLDSLEKAITPTVSESVGTGR